MNVRDDETSRERHIVQPNCFKVYKDWKNWVSKFERFPLVNKCPDEQKCDFLSV